MKRFIIATCLLFVTSTLFVLPAVQAQTTYQITRGNTSACATVCQKTLSYCTTKRGKHGEQIVTNALKDAITSCKLTSEFLSRDSAYQERAAAICVDALLACAKTCDSFANDTNMKVCADECRKTASNCQKLAVKTTPGRQTN